MNNFISFARVPSFLDHYIHTIHSPCVLTVGEGTDNHILLHLENAVLFWIFKEGERGDRVSRRHWEESLLGATDPFASAQK